jgi:hypothetical protein
LEVFIKSLLNFSALKKPQKAGRQVLAQIPINDKIDLNGGLTVSNNMLALNNHTDPPCLLFW